MSAGWAVCGNFADFAALPSVVLVEIYKHLSFEDRLRASSTCRAWRDCLFHPRFWTSLTVRLGRKRNKWRRAEFLARKCGRFVRHFELEFDCSSGQIVSQCIAVLTLLGDNRQLASLSLRPTACVVAWPLCSCGGSRANGCAANENETVAVYDRFVEAIRQVIRTSVSLEHLSLGCLEDLVLQSDSLLALLALHQRRSLRQLHLASAKEDPDHYPIPEVRLRRLQSLERLSTLGVDYDYVCDQLLLLLGEQTQLLSLVLHVHGLDDRQRVCDRSWEELRRSCPRLRVTLVLLHTCESLSTVRSVLSPAMPLRDFRSYFSEGFRGEVLDVLSARYAETLQTVAVVNALSEGQSTPRRTFAVRAESPVVMLAWRCHQLGCLQLVGHEIADTDVIAIARLRGPQLKELVVPADCVSESSGGPYYSELRPADVRLLEAEVSSSLLRTWTLSALRSPAQSETGQTRSYLRTLQQLQSYGSA
uniref:Putative f-box n=1 Tax=Ixodes ricinus TaxID=34613 RepID=A0A131XUJ6_IXORI